MPVHRLLYRSESALVGSGEPVEREVAEIVRASRTANEAAGLTGALLLSSGVFTQALEGPLDAVEASFERICGDLRHRRVRLLEFAVAEERVFGEWSMARVTPTRELVRLCPGLGAGDDVGVDAATTAATIQLMRALLLTGAMPAEPPGARST